MKFFNFSDIIIIESEKGEKISMELTNKEVKTLKAVLYDLVTTFQDDELNRFMGSETIKDMKVLQQKLHYYDYCKAHGIAYEDMTEDDFIQEYEERIGW